MYKKFHDFFDLVRENNPMFYGMKIGCEPLRYSNGSTFVVGGTSSSIQKIDNVSIVNDYEFVIEVEEITLYEKDGLKDYKLFLILNPNHDDFTVCLEVCSDLYQQLGEKQEKVLSVI